MITLREQPFDLYRVGEEGLSPVLFCFSSRLHLKNISIDGDQKIYPRLIKSCFVKMGYKN